MANSQKDIRSAVLAVIVPLLVVGPAIAALYVLPPHILRALARMPDVMKVVRRHPSIDPDLLLAMIAGVIALTASLAWGLIAWRVFRPIIQRLDDELPCTED